MADKAKSKKAKDEPRAPQPSEDDFDIDADLYKLKRSRYVLGVIFAILVAVLFILMLVSLSGYFKMQQQIAPPAQLKIVYTAEDVVLVYTEPHPETNAIYGLNKDARLFEVQRVPGFAQVEWGNDSGWVETSMIKAKVEQVARNKGMASAPLKVDLSPLIEGEKDIAIHGTITNISEQPLGKIHIQVYYLNKDREQMFTSEQILSPDKYLEPRESVNFEAVGKSLAGNAVYFAWEIDNFEVKAPEGLAGPAAPAASPSTPAAPAGGGQ